MALVPAGPRAVMTYHPHNLPIKRIIMDKWQILQDDEDTRETFPVPPSVAFRRPQNIRDSVVRSRLRPPFHPPLAARRTHPCGKPNCKSCPWIDKNLTIQGPGGRFTVRRSFSCQMSGLVYAVRCLKCAQCVYVGETGRTFESRTEDHERGVRLAYATAIGCHFNDGEHSRLDFRIQIVWLLQHNSQVNRKIIESKFIARLGTLKPAGLNLHP